ncbi:MAG: phosphoadenosine phosphosulfate reductase family protein [Planctomycetes bacterium]|nr:phosphoadenosine phosphosulfate reductase family protein [Planctomycetota bacterium]
MNHRKFACQQIQSIRRIVGNGTAVSALSGGVDSAVTTVLAHKALGKRLKVLFIDDGLMRQDEPQAVRKAFARMGIQVTVVQAARKFFAALAGLTDPEEKRKAFRDTFYKVFGKAVRESGAEFLLQGTIAPDIIETKKGVKTQHNVLDQIGISAKRGYGFRTIEPLKTLYKPGVRQVGRALGLPKALYQRMPFPGPGLSCRVLGEVTPERVEVVRQGCRIVEEETARFKRFQAFAVLLADRATGVTKDGRRAFGHFLCVRCVDSENAITAAPTKLPWAVLMRIQRRLTREIPGVTKVVYDITPKPPSTIEYI